MSIQIVLQKTSFVDFPGKISAVFFFPGCNLRCPWCHNRELVTGGLAAGGAKNLVSIEDGLAYLKKRRSVLGGAVLSGGEPCLREELPGLVGEIKKYSLPVKLDTNGMFPAALENLFTREDARPDYIALDLKLAPERYGELLPGKGSSAPASITADSSTTGSRFEPGEALKQSAALVRRSGIAHEYRTIVLPGGFLTEADIEALAPLADDAPWFFRPFRGGNCLDQTWDSLEETAAQARSRAETLAEKAKTLKKNVIIL